MNEHQEKVNGNQNKRPNFYIFRNQLSVQVNLYSFTFASMFSIYILNMKDMNGDHIIGIQ